MKQVPELLKYLWREPVWRINPSERVIYLTFDDGPNPQVTPSVLEILDRYNACATFFCVGENVEKYPTVFSELKSRGHVVGNHTYNHLKGSKTSDDEYVGNVMKADVLIKSHLFRPPYGRIKFSQYYILKKHFQIIMWDIITYDYDKQVSPEMIMREIRDKSRNGSLVVFHDSLKAEKNLFQVLPIALDYWISEGYSFKSIEL